MNYHKENARVKGKLYRSWLEAHMVKYLWSKCDPFHHWPIFVLAPHFPANLSHQLLKPGEISS